MATVYVIANQKGGIGKTTTATTLAGILNQKGKTLLIDADPQGNSTSTYQAAIEDTATLYDVMVDEDPVPLDEAVQHMQNGDIVALDPLLAKAGKLLDGNVEGMYRLQDALEMLDGYDYIVIDTAPSLDIVLYNCLIAADEVIIPVTADAFALQGLTKCCSKAPKPQFADRRSFACEVRRPLQFGKRCASGNRGSCHTAWH